MIYSMIYPWQQAQWQSLWRAKQNNRLPHAFIFAGMKGIGKTELAEAFSCALLCKQVSAEGKSCHQCHSCRLIAGKAHPNILWITPEKTGAAIKIDQIRDVSDFIAQSALQGEFKIVIIAKADDMNMNAANALLKTLEEPSAQALLILVSDQLERLPATILSRCQRILFPRPTHQEALNWLQKELDDSTVNANLLLQLAQGAPLTALQLRDDDIISARKELLDTLCGLNQDQRNPIKSTSDLQSMDTLIFLDFNLSFICDLLCLQLNTGDHGITNKDYVTQLKVISDQRPLQANVKLMNELFELRKQVSLGINFNKQLLMENVLVKWMR